MSGNLINDNEGYTVEGYLRLLKISLDYVSEYHKLVADDYNENYPNTLNSQNYINLHYHIFSFSQIVYTISEKLLDKYREDSKKDKINGFFRKYEGMVKKIFIEGQKWKHKNDNEKKVNKGLDLHNEHRIDIVGCIGDDNTNCPPPKYTYIGIKFNDETFGLDVCKKAYNEIKDFVKTIEDSEI